jgi:hypothetical protein
MHVRLDASNATASGDETVTFSAGRPLRVLIFRVWAAGPLPLREGTRIHVGAVTERGRELTAQRPNPTTLVVPLGRTLGAGEEVAVSVPWTLRLPAGAFDRIAKTGDVFRLGSFFPLLAWDPRRGWVSDPPATIPGEASTSPVADFDVTVDAPAGDRVLATGEEVSPGHFRAHAVRDFALAAGPFAIATATAHAPNPVRVTVGAAGPVAQKPQLYAAAAARALERLSRLYGPYPWPSLSASLTVDLAGSGIEYPGMIFLGPGPARFVATHETAHQWFYSLVGNDQARDPWLDEGLASWAQGRAGFPYPRRRIPAAARGHMGASMTYWDRHPRAYGAGVYAQSVAALRSLGAPEKVDCALRLYVARNAYSIAQPSDLLAALRRFFPKVDSVLRRFGA